MQEPLCVFGVSVRKPNYKTDQKSCEEELRGKSWMETKAGTHVSSAGEQILPGLGTEPP